MAITPGLQLPYGIQPTNPVPVDAWSGPFTAGSFLEGISTANAAIAGAVRFQSMEVRLIVGGESYKYWYAGGTADGDLVPFLGGTGPTGTTGATGATGVTGATGIDGATGATPTNYVISLNGLTGAVGITAGSNITLTPSGNIITISSSGSGGTAASNFTEGITAPSTPTKGDRWFNTADGGLYTAITDDSGVIWTQLNAGILGPTGATGNINVSAGEGITISNSVISIDTAGGVTFTGPIRGSTLYLTGDLIVTGRIITSTGIFGATANNIIESVEDMIMDGGEF